MVSSTATIALSTVGGLAALGLAAWHLGTIIGVDLGCEKPKYTLLKTLGSKRR